VSFPIVRPEDVEQMPEPVRDLMFDWLDGEVREAAKRNQTILAERHRRAAEAAVVPRTGRPPGTLFISREERQDGERILAKRRELVRTGKRTGMGTAEDDLVAAATAVRAGSRNPYLLLLVREYERWQRARRRTEARQLNVPDRRAS
jgi:hypothetical protein